MTTRREILEAKIKAVAESEIAAMDALKKYKEDNRIEFFTRPNPRQAELLEAWNVPQNKVFTYTGGNRTGKTTIGVILAIATIYGHFPWSKERLKFNHSGARKVRIVGQDWEKHIKTVVVPELRKWWPKGREVKIKKNNTGVEAMWTDVKTGSSIEIMSNKQESELHEGWQGDLVYYDEPPKRDIRVANARGLVDREGKEIFCMTLLKEAWVDQEVIKAVNPDGTPDMSVFNVHAEIYDNIGYGITKEGVAQFEKTLTDDEKEARLRGVPSYMSGLICKKFQRKRHLIDRFKIPLDWIVDIGIDIHPRKEQAILFVATSPRNERYIFHEVWEHGDGTWVGEQIIRIITRNALRVGRIICDPLAKGDSNNDNTTFDKIDAVLDKHGYYLRTASKDKNSGIIEINNHLEGPNKQPSLFIFNDLVRTVKEIESWMWDEETQKAKKENDDMMENLYRILLEDTQWEPMDDEDEEEIGTTNSVTGY